MLSFYLAAVNTDTDKDKLRYIYKNYYSYMAYTAGKVLSDRHDIEDAVHNAMLTLIEHLDLFDFSDDRKAKNLCGIIAKNKAIDHIKRMDNATAGLDTETLDLFAPVPSPETETISRENYETVVKTIMSMSNTYKDVCYLKYINGFKEREIADILGITPEAVKSRIFRGKQMIRKLLQKEGIYE